MSTSNMARWAKTHSIPLRPRGSASHNQALRAADEADRASRILRPALTGRGTDERLSRFAAASAHPSLSAAAAALGLNTFTLVAQINRIERELGGPLLIRAERRRPMTLTPLGKKVLKAIRKMQDNTMP
ncbi:LysR family transcriptional regulator [Streptomyces sp. LaPpAH-108]|uniref:LysR family transcriptional regulator n=1 Tax=Streptomyces sp. LaPpAH-108 TaxID=1155714 RepID=UPI001F453BE6|nr:LysR family transcriptional regulator [Streptomyces sp. LaPpAH-108]